MRVLLILLFHQYWLHSVVCAWSKVPSNNNNNKAPKVSGHSCSAGRGQNHNDAVILFGGLTGPAGSPCSNDTWMMSLDDGDDHKSEWILLQPSTRPRVRMYAASAFLGGQFYIFGGWDPGAPGSGGEFLDDVWVFNPSKKEWKLLEDIKLPFPVSRHTACTVQSKIILHTYKGILVFDGTSLISQPTALVGNNDDDDDEARPNGLSMCAVAPLNDHQMLLVGGSTKTQQMSQDAFVLDIHTWTWSKLQHPSSTSSSPPVMASACAAQMLLQANQVLVFGGASIGTAGYEGGMGLIPLDETWILHVSLDMKQVHWTKVEFDLKPPGRVAASLTPITHSSKLLLQGGYDPLTKTTFEEPWVLDMKKL